MVEETWLELDERFVWGQQREGAWVSMILQKVKGAQRQGLLDHSEGNTSEEGL